MKIKFEEFINEGYFSNIIDYYKIFGFKSLLIKPFAFDKTNIRKTGFFLSKNNKIYESDVLKIINQVSDFYYNEKKLKFIGSGYFGSVYQTPNEKMVLKITTDFGEICRAEKFRKMITNDLIVDYYDVREIKIYRKNIELEVKLWALIIEKIDPLNKFEKSLWKKISDSFHHTILPKDKSILKDLYANKFFQNRELDKNLPENLTKIYNKMIKFIEKIVKFVDKHNMILQDLHENNIGKTKDGEYKIFDSRAEYESIKLSLKPIIVEL